MLQHCQCLKKAAFSNVQARNLMTTLISKYSVAVSQVTKKCLTRTDTQPSAKFMPNISVRTMKILTPTRRVRAKNKEDKVDSEYQMIYHNHMWRYYEYGKPVSLLFGSPLIVMDLLLFYQRFVGHTEFFPDKIFNNHYTMMEPTLYLSVGTVFLFGLIYTVHRLTRLYISRIYYNSDRDHYIGIIQKGLFGKTKVHFNIKDVTPAKGIENPLLLVFKGNVSIKGRSFLVTEEDFLEVYYYNRLLGHVLNEPSEPAPLDISKIGQNVERFKRKHNR